MEMADTPAKPSQIKPKTGLKLSKGNEQTLLKAVLLAIVQNFLQETIIKSHKKYQKESYAMDQQIMKHIIQGILETGNYTLEGIAHDTNIPFDVIYEAALGHTRELSITPWSRIIALFFNVRPDIAQLLINKLLHTLGKERGILNGLLN